MTKTPVLNRRTLMKSGAVALFAAAAGPLPVFVRRAAAHAPTPTGRTRVLVTIFQRFGMDGLLAVTPYADATLASLRPNLMLSAPGSGKDDARLDLGEGYGLHPSLAALLPLYASGQLAIVHGVGSPDPTRSHGEAQRWWESGAPGDPAHRDGWLNRAVSAARAPAGARLRAAALADERPRILYGAHEVVSMPDLDALRRPIGDDTLLAELEHAYRAADQAELRDAARSFDVARILSASQDRANGNDPGYPANSTLAASLRDIARLIRADLGLQVAFAESRRGAGGMGTWDTHSMAAPVDGPFGIMGTDLSTSLAAFWKDLGERRDDVVVVTLTDFGRNVVENERLGCDHGRATAMFVLGTRVRGGRVHGSLPERFERDALEDGMDLPVTTDFRAVLSSLTRTQLGIADDRRVFPGFTGAPLDLLRA